MSPAQQGASRLGWVMIGAIVVFTIMGNVIPTGWVGFAIAVILWTAFFAVGQTPLYRWVTAPERDAEAQSNPIKP